MSTQQQTDTAAVLSALAAPFDRNEVKFRPGAVSSNRALALPYIDARCVQDRLDAVVGAANWQDEYQLLPDGSALCRLSLRLGGEWIVKADVGGPSDQPDGGDRHKAAVSDALKRAAVKWGVGRYLYRLPLLWCDFDSARKRFARKPELAGAAPAPAPVAAAVKGKPIGRQTDERPAPTTPAELADRLRAFGSALVKAGLCKNAEELLASVRGQLDICQTDPATWPAPLIGPAMQAAREFEAHRRQHAAPNGTKA
jgi:hypothetical protein